MPPKTSKGTAPSATVGVTSKPSKAPNSWSRAILQWGIIAPLVTLLLAITIPVAYNYSRLQVGQPYSIIANQTVLDLPTAYHSRWRGPDYINKYDRFFFQWWNFLVYDAETHDHWTLVYHTTKFSKAAKYANYASTSMVHKKGPDDVLSAHEAIPLEDLVHTQDWNLGMRRADGSIPHTITVIDDDTYNIVANMDTSDVSNGKNVRWNLTFHRVHGIYSGVDGEKSNEDNCAIVSTLFGYHTKVSGWIEEGDQRWTFGADGAAGNRYRGYAAGSWGCKLPAGYPEIDYPWTWFWLTIPGDATATPPTPDIGMAMGTARFQLNVSALGDMYGGFATVGVGSEITSASFATLRHKSPYEVPLIKASTDDFLKFYENGLSNWTDITDESGTFSIPLVQTYDIETAHHRFLVKFHTRPEQYFRLPVIVEHLEPAGIRPNPRRLAVFSDFRACGVKTEVKVWKRKLSPAQQLAAKRQIGGSKSEPKDTNTAATNEWEAGGWDEVVYDGVVNSLNAIEFAYQAPVSDKVYDKYLEPQKFELK